VLIPIVHLKKYWLLDPRGTLHVGAHLGEEMSEYHKYGFDPVIWVEAQPDLATELASKVKSPSIVLQAVAWSKDGEELQFKVTNNGQSSSVFEFGTHTEFYPEVAVESVQTMSSARLDSILPSDLKPNFLNLDIQGAEYEALVGLGDLIQSFDYVYSEVNRAQVYAGIKQVAEIDGYLNSFGFIRVATYWTGAAWGDALYLRKSWALKKYHSPLALKNRILAYRIYTWASRLSPKRLVPRFLSTTVKLSRNIFQSLR
jgi:FkbM family methyltransferase